MILRTFHLAPYSLKSWIILFFDLDSSRSSHRNPILFFSCDRECNERRYCGENSGSSEKMLYEDGEVMIDASGSYDEDEHEE